MERHEYIRRLLEAYRATPGTCGAVRRPDRLLAAQLHERGVPLEAVENALILAAARRMTGPPMLRLSESFARWRTSRRSSKRSCVCRLLRSTSAICAAASHASPQPSSFAAPTPITPAAWMMMPLPSSLSTCALTARMMMRASAFSILFSARVTLTKRYWVTSDERRSCTVVMAGLLSGEKTAGFWPSTVMKNSVWSSFSEKYSLR